MDQFHQPPRPRLVCSLHEDRPNGMNSEGLLVPLLFFDEVIVGAELLQHVGRVHCAAICLVEKVSLALRRAFSCRKAQREEGVWFHW